MYPVLPGELVLVTGLTGFVGSHVTQQLLAAGYRVRGTVRDLASSKSTHIKSVFGQYGDKLNLVEASDLEADGVFDQAVHDVQGIVHVASPCHYNFRDAYVDCVNPAVNGTISLLRSAKAYGRSVKAVVITSSSAAIIQPQKPGYVYTENDWNSAAIEQLEKEYRDGGRVDPGNAYRASKTLAEREAWRFMEVNKPQFSLTTVNPANIFGPVVHEIANAAAVNLSVGMVFKYFSGEQSDIGQNAPAQSFVDVRDVALMHVRALQRTSAFNKRFIATSDTFTFQQLVDVIRRNYPAAANRVVEGEPGSNYETLCRYDNSRAKELLGISFIPFERSIVDTFDSLRQFPWMHSYYE